jgi:hypothetical protein
VIIGWFISTYARWFWGKGSPNGHVRQPVLKQKLKAETLKSEIFPAGEIFENNLRQTLNQNQVQKLFHRLIKTMKAEMLATFR